MILLPLTIKQHKSTAKMQEIQPLITDIQNRYKNDKEKLNQEVMKVYQENNANPAGGCLPLLIQSPIIITLYWVIVQPLKFMLSKTASQIDALAEFVQKAQNIATPLLKNQREIMILSYFDKHRDALSQVNGLLSENELINFNNFLGLHLGDYATYKLDKLFGPEAYIYIPLFILVVISVVTMFISTKISMPKPQDDKKSSSQQAAAGMSNSMMYVGPIMTALVSFSIPSGVVLYWTVGNIVQLFQQLYINKFILKKYDKPEDKKITGKNGAAENALNNGEKKAISGNESKVSGNNSSPKSGQGNKNKNNKKKK
jgi:YidC/Oxa1 family membrane protein insertase